MPHRCTECSNIVPDESEDLFGGCGTCGNQSWEYVEDADDTESESQKQARTEFVSDDELPDNRSVNMLQNPTADTDETNESVRKVDKIDELREKLNDQYEGIKIHRKGHYEINLTELYRGTEHIIEIGDDGAYQVKNADDINR